MKVLPGADTHSTVSALPTFVPARVPPLDLAAVHAEHAEFVWRSLQRLGVPESDLEDLLQEVFVVVHRRLDTYRAEAKLTTWLFGICLRVVSNHRRQRARRRETPIEGVVERSANAASPEEQLATKEALGEVASILDRMDLGKRAVFVMSEVEEMSCDAIAVALGVPEGTVHSRLHAARKVLARAMARSERGERAANAHLLAALPPPYALPAAVRLRSLTSVHSLVGSTTTVAAGAGIKGILAVALMVGAAGTVAVAAAIGVPGSGASANTPSARADTSSLSAPPAVLASVGAPVLSAPPLALESASVVASSVPPAVSVVASGARGAERRTAPVASGAVDPLTDESTRLGEANAMLVHEPAKALAAVDACEAAHPNGQMWDEAEYIAVQALVALGRKADARARADALGVRAPKSVFARLADQKVRAVE